jgi:hypothetical protein
VTRRLSTVRPSSCPGRYEDEGEEWDGGEEDEVEPEADDCSEEDDGVE